MISILLPAYNEAENLNMIIPRLHETMGDIEHEILVIDTVEPMDETEEVCRASGAKYVPREGGNTYGDAIRTAFDKSSGEFAVIMDADGSHDPKYIPEMIERQRVTGCDLVIGSRYCKGGHTDNGPLLRAMSWSLNYTYRLFFGLKVKDVSDSYRLYKTEQIKALDLESSNFDIVEEVLIKLNLYNNGFSIEEVPISFNKRVAGESKRKTLQFIRSYLGTLFKMMGFKRRYKKRMKEESRKNAD